MMPPSPGYAPGLRSSHEQTADQTFRATLRPYRSLGRKGFIILMTVLIGLNFAAGTAFYLLGAWPVAPFLGADVVLVWWAFRKNYSDALKEERIEVTAHELILRRFDHNKEREELHFTRDWVKIELEEDADRDLIGNLYLRSAASAPRSASSSAPMTARKSPSSCAGRSQNPISDKHLPAARIGWFRAWALPRFSP